jgi:hypothetical protein
VYRVQDPQLISQISQRSGFSEQAVMAALRALQQGGGSMAQFDHPEFGGVGQWTSGMVMIGEMSNHALKARVAQLFAELSQHAAPHRSPFSSWCPADLGIPDQTGGQNDIRYAVFRDSQRLAVRSGSDLMIYDLRGHEVVGASQQQGGGLSSIVLHTRAGIVPIDSLPLLGKRRIV